MKTLYLSMAVVIFGFIAFYNTIATAQRYGWGGGYHASTAAEGYARGMGDVIRSAGQARSPAL